MMEGDFVGDDRVQRSHGERLATIEAVCRTMASILTSIKQDIKGDSDRLDALIRDVARLNFEVGSEREARRDLAQQVSRMMTVVDENKQFRRDTLMIAAAAAAIISGAIAQLPRVLAWLGIGP